LLKVGGNKDFGRVMFRFIHQEGEKGRKSIKKTDKKITTTTFDDDIEILDFSDTPIKKSNTTKTQTTKKHPNPDLLLLLKSKRTQLARDNAYKTARGVCSDVVLNALVNPHYSPFDLFF
jgi:hypothetical protein